MVLSRRYCRSRSGLGVPRLAGVPVALPAEMTNLS